MPFEERFPLAIGLLTLPSGGACLRQFSFSQLLRRCMWDISSLSSEDMTFYAVLVGQPNDHSRSVNTKEGLALDYFLWLA